MDRLRARLHAGLERLYDRRATWAVLFLAVVSPLVLGRRPAPEPPALPAGAVAAAGIVATETREFVDEAVTRVARAAARAEVRPLYDLDSQALTDATESARAAFEIWRGARQAPPGGTVVGLAPEATVRARAFVSGEPPGARFEEHVVQALAMVYQRRIVGSRALLPAAGRVRVRDTRTGHEWDEDASTAALSLDEARRAALQALRSAGAGDREAAAMGPFLQDRVTPNLVFNSALTESRRREAEGRIEPLRVRIPKGKVLLRRGEIAGEDAARMLAAYAGASDPRRGRETIVGTLLLLGLLVLFMNRYVDFYRGTGRRDRHLFALLVIVTVIALTVDRGFLWLFDHLVASLRVEPYANPALYRFMVPLATGAMLITLLVGPRVGLAYTLFSLPLFGMMVRFDPALLLYGLISNLAAVYGIVGYRRRTAPIKAGMILGAINALAVPALLALPGPLPPASHIAFQMACGFGGGILVAVLVSFLLPLLEAAFNILTDVRLLELSNLNNPLLRRLAVEAPGSYNHSVIVGTLAEAAAEAIGANALFCRVAAYYHDVGKLLKPGYFIENQRPGDNRHDRLSPHMSALVITSHVKEGYELARSHGLPQEVLDIIPQHHGTRKINYFYQKALKSEGAPAGAVQESDFRYPGPKPQTKEAAIFMLSDSIEAAARTLEDPSPARFKGLIRKIVSDVVLDDQLDESDLTFSDLEKAEGAFLRTLSSIYHHRIDYPGFDFEKVAERPFHGSRTHEEPPPAFKRWGR